MSLIGRAFKFTLGTAVGVGVGAAAALLFAPESGQELQHEMRDRVTRAKRDGADAQLAKRTELIRKFRAEVNDPEALREYEADSKAERDRAAVQATL